MYGSRRLLVQASKLQAGAAHVVSSRQKAALRAMRNLAMFNDAFITMLVAYAYSLKMPLSEIIPWS